MSDLDLRLEIADLKRRVAKLEGRKIQPAVVSERDFFSEFGLGAPWEHIVLEANQRKIQPGQVIAEKALLSHPEKLASAAVIDNGTRYLIERFSND